VKENQQSEAAAPIQYRLLRETGRGAMSLVWEAVDTRTGRRVAIKTLVVPRTLGAEERAAWAARMDREARAVARLSHPNIVAIYAVGEEDGQPYLVMEFLEGRTLRQRLHEGPLGLEDAARVLEQAAAALDAVHAAGIAHRDIKPANFMLLADGMVKLADFGLARQEDDALVTQAHMMVGSPSYLAPEYINGASPGPAGDVWSLGVILYEMLAGQSPFGGDRISDVLHQITAADPPSVPRMPPAVQVVLSRALAKDPIQRYPSAGALAAAFRDALRVPASPFPSEPFPVAAPARRGLSAPLRRVLLALVFLLLLALLVLALRRH